MLEILRLRSATKNRWDFTRFLASSDTVNPNPTFALKTPHEQKCNHSFHEPNEARSIHKERHRDLTESKETGANRKRDQKSSQTLRALFRDIATSELRIFGFKVPSDRL